MTGSVPGGVTVEAVGLHGGSRGRRPQGHRVGRPGDQGQPELLAQGPLGHPRTSPTRTCCRSVVVCIPGRGTFSRTSDSTVATSSTISTSSRWIHSIELQLQQLRLRRAGEAVADAAKMSWENLAQQTLSGPLSMTETSYRQSDYDRAPRPTHFHGLGWNLSYDDQGWLQLGTPVLSISAPPLPSWCFRRATGVL